MDQPAVKITLQGHPDDVETIATQMKEFLDITSASKNAQVSTNKAIVRRVLSAQPLEPLPADPEPSASPARFSHLTRAQKLQCLQAAEMVSADIRPSDQPGLEQAVKKHLGQELQDNPEAIALALLMVEKLAGAWSHSNAHAFHDPALAQNLDELLAMAKKIGAQEAWIVRDAATPFLSFALPNRETPAGPDSARLNFQDGGTLVVLCFAASDGREARMERR
jgi:hypothetical protein